MHARIVEPATSSRASRGAQWVGEGSGEGRVIDDAVVTAYRAPASFTGEDVVEFALHGSPVIARRLLEALSRLGVRQALPGEFSFRAVRNGKMTVSQAEAVADLIAASNEMAAELALEKLSGTQNALVREFSESLRQLATMGEVGIDFADQDVEELSLPVLKKRVEETLARLRVLESSYERGTRIQEGISVAFVGLPNAGKSSFFNALLGEDRSIVSEVAGTTRDVVREKLTLRGRMASVTLRLSDTAGLRETSDQVEKIGVERTQAAARSADLVILVADAPAAASGAVAELEKQWRALGAPVERAIGVLSKVDLVTGPELVLAQERVAGLGLKGAWLATSAVTGAGVAEAGRAIADFSERWVHRDRGEVVLTRLSHLEAARSAIEHLERARSAQAEDLFASDLRQALVALSPLIGETVPDDILGRVFSQFCIGK